MLGDEIRFDWADLVPPFVNPLKVTILEAMLWIGEPLAASDLAKVFDGEFQLALLSYHLTKLREAGILRLVEQGQDGRGALQRIYFFPER